MEKHDKWPGTDHGDLGLTLSEDLPFKGWVWWGHYLLDQGDKSWRLGDWLSFGKKRFSKPGSKTKDAYRTVYQSITKHKGYSDSVLRRLRSVAEQFDLSRRRPSVPPSRYFELVAYTTESQERLLDVIEREGDEFSRDALRHALKGAVRKSDSIPGWLVIESTLPDDEGRRTFMPWSHKGPMDKLGVRYGDRGDIQIRDAEGNLVSFSSLGDLISALEKVRDMETNFREGRVPPTRLGLGNFRIYDIR
jgi:hypothetical protein